MKLGAVIRKLYQKIETISKIKVPFFSLGGIKLIKTFVRIIKRTNIAIAPLPHCFAYYV